MRKIDNKKQDEIKQVQKLVVESFEIRNNGVLDYTLDEAFGLIQKDIEKECK